MTALAHTGSARARKILSDGWLISGLDLDIADNMALKADGSAMEMMERFGDIAPVLTLPAYACVNRTRDLRAHMAEVLATCGARPEIRDPIDARIVADVKAGTGWARSKSMAWRTTWRNAAGSVFRRNRRRLFSDRTRRAREHRDRPSSLS